MSPIIIGDPRQFVAAKSGRSLGRGRYPNQCKDAVPRDDAAASDRTGPRATAIPVQPHQALDHRRGREEPPRSGMCVNFDTLTRAWWRIHQPVLTIRSKRLSFRLMNDSSDRWTLPL